MLSAKDFKASLVIGAAVGLLIQPILANTLASVHLTLAMRIGIFVFFALFAPFALWLCSLIGKLWKAFYQFGQFAAVGTLNSFIDIGIFNLETFFYGTSAISIPLFAVFKAISFLCATTNSFFWNRNWTFGSTDKVNAGEVTGFYTIALIGWAANVAVATLVKSVGPETTLWVDIVAPLAGILVTFIWNFIGYKYFVFKKRAPATIAS
jgi:putative flippase GtrA